MKEFSLTIKEVRPTQEVRQDLDKIVSLLANLPLPIPEWNHNFTTDILINAASTLSEADKDISNQIIERVFNFALTLGKEDRRSIYGLTARRFARTGQMAVAQRAFDLAQALEEEKLPYLYQDMAYCLYKNDLDPEPMLVKSKQFMGNSNIGYSRITQIEYRDDWRVMDFPRLAKIYLEVGKDPKPLLKEGLALARKLKKDSPTRHYVSANFAEIFAEVGDISSARRIAGRDSDIRFNIAKIQIQKRDLEEALQTVATSNKVILADVIARVAIAKAETGQSGNSEIAKVLEAIATIDSKISRAILFAMLGRAKALSGENPMELFSKSMDLFIESNCTLSNFIRLVEEIDSGGYNATPVLTYLLEDIDMELKDIKNPDFYSSAFQVFDWEDLAKLSIKKGYFDFAKIIISRLEDNKEFIDVYLGLLAELAASELISK